MSAPNVETVPVSGRNRCGLALTVKSTGERCALSDLARRAGQAVRKVGSRLPGLRPTDRKPEQLGLTP